MNNIFAFSDSAETFIHIDLEHVGNAEQPFDYPGLPNEMSFYQINRNSTRTKSFSSFSSTDNNSADDLDFWPLEPSSKEPVDVTFFLIKGSIDYDGLEEIPVTGTAQYLHMLYICNVHPQSLNCHVQVVGMFSNAVLTCKCPELTYDLAYGAGGMHKVG